MSKTRYIKGKDGKFAGSIGSGKHAVPASTVAPTPATAAVDHPWAHIPAPQVITDVPAYFHRPPAPVASTAAALTPPPGRPDLTERSTWGHVHAQTALEEFVHGPTGLFSTLWEPPASLSYPAELDTLRVRAQIEASALRAEGKPHQAAALEWVVATAASVRDGLASVHATDTDEGTSSIVVFVDEDNEYAITAEDDGTVNVDYGSEPGDWVIDMGTMRSHAREMFTGAVIMDYLTVSGGDVDAAKVLASLDT